MISSEVIKTFQVQIIEYDKEMKQDPDDQLKLLSLKLHEDLGMIKYIFSDKTGTLTKNEMSFRGCSIFAKSFGDIEEDLEKNNEEKKYNNDRPINQLASNSQFNFNSIKNSNLLNNNITNNNIQNNIRKSIFSAFFNKELLRNSILEGGIMNIKDINESPIKTLGEACKEFFLNIALNHNVLVELDEEEEEAKRENILKIMESHKNKNFNTVKNMNDEMNNMNTKSNNDKIINFDGINQVKNNILEMNNNIKYQGSNPDEIVLVTSASEIGIKFLTKDKDDLIINFLGEIKKYRILHKFEFSSERKRSSIIVEDEEKKIKIYVKGSDEKILHKSNINEFSKQNLLKETKEHLDSFARIGLRTLCFGYKYIERTDYINWDNQYKKKKLEVIIDKNKAFELERIISEMEQNLILLGVTALEDKLQDNVKNDLQEFIEAGISVWMITGDKLDTAESIGHSCKLFNDDTEVFKIKSSEKRVTK